MSRAESEKKSLIKSKKYYVLGFSAILAIGFVHFAAQMFFIQNENLRFDETAAESAPPILTVEPEKVARNSVTEEKPSVKKADIVSTAEIAAPKARRQPQISRRQPPFVPARTATRRKTVPESSSARLRRAELILTGI